MLCRKLYHIIFCTEHCMLSSQKGPVQSSMTSHWASVSMILGISHSHSSWHTWVRNGVVTWLQPWCNVTSMSQKLFSMSQKSSPWAREVRWLTTCSQVITEARADNLEAQLVHSDSFLVNPGSIFHSSEIKLTRMWGHRRHRSRPQPAWRCSCRGQVPPGPQSSSSRSGDSCHSVSGLPHLQSLNTGGPGVISKSTSDLLIQLDQLTTRNVKLV